MNKKFEIRYTDRNGIPWKAHTERCLAQVLSDHDITFVYEPWLRDQHGCIRVPDFFLPHPDGYHGICVEVSAMFDTPSYLAGWLSEGQRGRCSRVQWYNHMAGRYFLYPVERTDSEAFYDSVAADLKRWMGKEGDGLLKFLANGGSAKWAEVLRRQLELRLDDAA